MTIHLNRLCVITGHMWRCYSNLRYNSSYLNFEPKWSKIYKHESDKNKKYLSEDNFEILSVIGVVCGASTA